MGLKDPCCFKWAFAREIWGCCPSFDARDAAADTAEGVRTGKHTAEDVSLNVQLLDNGANTINDANPCRCLGGRIRAVLFLWCDNHDASCTPQALPKSRMGPCRARFRKRSASCCHWHVCSIL